MQAGKMRLDPLPQITLAESLAYPARLSSTEESIGWLESTRIDVGRDTSA
jgi:hypothetical protein